MPIDEIAAISAPRDDTEFVAPPPKRQKFTYFTVQPPVRGPGRAPGVKKRGPGRPPKRRPEEAPGFCPEFLEPDLLTATSIPQNVKRTELVYHFHHVDAHHTQADTTEEVIDLNSNISQKTVCLPPTQHLSVLLQRYSYFPSPGILPCPFDLPKEFHKRVLFLCCTVRRIKLSGNVRRECGLT